MHVIADRKSVVFCTTWGVDCTGADAKGANLVPFSGPPTSTFLHRLMFFTSCEPLFKSSLMILVSSVDLSILDLTPGFLEATCQ